MGRQISGDFSFAARSVPLLPSEEQRRTTSAQIEMKKFFGFGSSTPPPPPPPSKPPAPPPKPASPSKAPPPSTPSAPTAPTQSIVGKWKEPNASDTTEFQADGAVTEKLAGGETIRGRYLFDGTHLKINLEGIADELTFSATLKGDSLEMKDRDGQVTHYQRISAA